MVVMTWPEVWAQRLARHALLHARVPASNLAALVGSVCGIHAQVMSAAELSIGIRVVGVTRRDIQAALWDRHQLVKTYGIRGTIHLFPAAELPLWMAALRTPTDQDERPRARVGLDSGRLDAIVQAIGAALDGQRLTLEELGAAVVDHVGAWAAETTAPAFGGQWPRWRMALGVAAAAGQLCYGPNAGRAVTFVRADQWVGSWHDLDPDAARAEVFRRYIHTYGPATPRDFAQWFSIPPAEAQAIATALKDELAAVDVEGHPSFVLADDRAALDGQPMHTSVRLLPHFDVYLIGCHPRDRLVPKAWADRVLARGVAGPVPVLLVNGTVAGVWARTAQARRVVVQVEPFAPLTSEQQDMLELEVRRIGEILGAEATLTCGPITVRPHL